MPMQMILVSVLFWITVQVNGQCPRPLMPTSIPDIFITSGPLNITGDRITCHKYWTYRTNPDNSGGIIDRQDYICDPHSRRWKGILDGWSLGEDQLMACVDASTVNFENCTIDLVDDQGKKSIFYPLQGSYRCRSGLNLEANSFGGIYTGNAVTCIDQTNWKVGNDRLTARPTVYCKDEPNHSLSTTTEKQQTQQPTAATLPPVVATLPPVTLPPVVVPVVDRTPPAIAFTNMRSYYNAQYRVHGYCGTDACRTRLWNEGFSRTDNAGIVGKIIFASSASLALAKEACPIGGEFLMLVGMVAQGRGFMHTFYEPFMPQGFVPTRPVCGATLPVRAYSPVIGDDIWYTTGSAPSGYKVRHDGRILFYLWPQ